MDTALGTYPSEMEKEAFQDRLELVYWPQESWMHGRTASEGPLASPVLVTDITNRLWQSLLQNTDEALGFLSRVLLAAAN